MQNLIQLIYNNQQKSKHTLTDFKYAEQIRKLVKPGDLILTRSQNMIFSCFRNILNSEYDHINIVINDEQVLDISYPNTTTLPLHYFLTPDKSPLILRLSPSICITDLLFLFQQTSISNQYDTSRLFSLIYSKYRQRNNDDQYIIQHSDVYNNSVDISIDNGQQKQNAEKKQQTRMQSRFELFLQQKPYNVCSEVLMWSICKLNPQVEQTIYKDIDYDYDFKLINSFSPDDFVTLMKKNPQVVQAIDTKHIDDHFKLEIATRNSKTIIERIKQTVSTFMQSNIQQQLQTKLFNLWYSQISFQKGNQYSSFFNIGLKVLMIMASKEVLSLQQLLKLVRRLSGSKTRLQMAEFYLDLYRLWNKYQKYKAVSKL